MSYQGTILAQCLQLIGKRDFAIVVRKYQGEAFSRDSPAGASSFE